MNNWQNNLNLLRMTTTITRLTSEPFMNFPHRWINVALRKSLTVMSRQPLIYWNTHSNLYHFQLVAFFLLQVISSLVIDLGYSKESSNINVNHKGEQLKIAWKCFIRHSCAMLRAASLLYLTQAVRGALQQVNITIPVSGRPIDPLLV